MDSTENSIIRIPLTYRQKTWIWAFALISTGFAIAALIMRDPIFDLFGALILIIPGSLVGGWIGRSPGRIEFASDHSYFVRARNEYFPWIYNGDNWEKSFPSQSFHLRLVDTGFRWSDERLEIITAKGAIFLGSGENMLPLRAWLLHHGMQPK